MTQNLKTTPLNALHKSLGGKMVEFAGYEMPVQYPLGVLKEHLHTREKAGLFDVSHMGQAVIVGADHESAARALETLAPGEIMKLGVGRQRLSVLLNEEGGILDDLMISRPACGWSIEHCRQWRLQGRLTTPISMRNCLTAPNLSALTIAAYWPCRDQELPTVLAKHAPGAAELKFMSFAEMQIGDVTAVVTRGGYTGEDGYEISTWDNDTEKVAKLLLDDPDVEPIGLGRARFLAT